MFDFFVRIYLFRLRASNLLLSFAHGAKRKATARLSDELVQSLLYFHILPDGDASMQVRFIWGTERLSAGLPSFFDYCKEQEVGLKRMKV